MTDIETETKQIPLPMSSPVAPPPVEPQETRVGAPEVCGERHEKYGWVCAKPADHEGRHESESGKFWPQAWK